MSAKRRKTRLDRTVGRNGASAPALLPGPQTTPELDPSFDPKVPEITANYRKIEISDRPYQDLSIFDSNLSSPFMVSLSNHKRTALRQDHA